MTQRDDLIAALAILAVASVGMVALLPPGIFSWAYWQDGGDSTSRSEVFRNVGLFFVAVIALGFGIWRAWTAHRQAEAAQAQAAAATEQARVANEQARIAQQGHITDRFSTAVEQLGSGQLPVRLGGIYGLWRLIKDSPERDVISVIDILCAFVRHPPHQIGQGPGPGASEDGQASAEMADEAGSTTRVGPDVQTVLNLLGSENADYRALLPDGFRLDLSGANLRVAELSGADLTDADLQQADLARANLRVTNLTNAYLGGADLTGAEFGLANLTYAYLTDAYLTDADLTDADITDTNVTAAYLEDTNVTQEQLDSACIIEGGPLPTLPEGLKPPQNVCGPRRW